VTNPTDRIAAPAILAILDSCLTWILAVSGSLTWPTANGVVTRIDIERNYSGDSTSGRYFSATFTHDFYGSQGTAWPVVGAKSFQLKP